MIGRSFTLALVAISLATPSAPAVSGSLTVKMCGGGTASIPIPIPMQGDKQQSNHGCCKGVCHFGDDRRKRRNGVNLPCH